MIEDTLFQPGPGVRVKVCGITREADGLAALEAGADFLGLVFYPRSPRCLTPARAAALLAALRREASPERVRPIGVFVNAPATEVAALAGDLGLTAVQLHGNEDIAYIRSLAGVRVLRAVRVRSETDLTGLDDFIPVTSAFLFDAYSDSAYGGTGLSFPHAIALSWIARHPLFIAGGLRPETVGGVIELLRPFAVDVSSGVEDAPGIKNALRIHEFLREARRAASRLADNPMQDESTHQ